MYIKYGITPLLFKRQFFENFSYTSLVIILFLAHFLTLKRYIQDETEKKIVINIFFNGKPCIFY